MKKLGTLLAVLFAVLLGQVGVSSSALAGSAHTAIFSGARNAYPNASTAIDFAGTSTNTVPFYKVNGVVYSSFKAIPGLSVARASVGYADKQDGTLVLFQAGEARITDKGLLVEEARTNLILQSQTLDNAAWSAVSGATVTADQTIAPDGTNTADQVSYQATFTQFKEVQQNIIVTSGTNYAYSLYIKPVGTQRYVQLLGSSVAFGTFYVNYDLLLGTEVSFAAGTSTIVSRNIQSLANGWYRLQVTATALASGGGARLSFDSIPADTSVRGVTWTPDGTQGFYIWGQDIEAGAFATSYIPTTTVAVTRPADVVSITGLSQVAPFTLGSTSNASGINSVGNSYVASLSDGTTANLAAVNFTATTAGTAAITASSAQTASGLTVTTTNSLIGVAAQFQTNALKAGVGGAIANSVTGTFTFPTLTRLDIGNRTDGTRPFSGYVRQVRIYPYAANDNELTTLSIAQ